MGIHASNELCNLHKGMHSAQRRLLPMEGHEENAEEILISLLEAEIEENIEMIHVLNYGIKQR